tara:strand:+ start:1599 stop:2816 length:1218 start_codon:yes stop_codon:yes gene_type:complete
MTAVNLMDRQILSVLVEDIKHEFGATDFAMGLLTGTAFAVFHAFAGIPIARLGDRSNRRNLIVVGLLAWSALTAATGLARSYTQIFLLRMSVGVGESVGSGPVHSVLSDYFPAERRGMILAIVGAGGTVGSLMAFALGGVLADQFGWRMTFVFFGIPGVFLALLIAFTVREPKRGAADGVVVDDKQESFSEVIRYLAGLKSYRHVVLFNAFCALATYSFVSWVVALLERVHDLSTAQAGGILALTMSVSAVIGAIAAGRIADRLGLKDARWYLGVPSIGAIIATPLLIGFLLSESLTVALCFLVPAALFNMAWLGTSNAMVQGLAKPRMRAVALQILLVFNAILGLGVGPALAGYLSDMWTPTYGEDALRYALVVCMLPYLWAVVHAVLAMKTLREDLELAKQNT